MTNSIRHPKNSISVLIVAADNMTGDLLENALVRERKHFVVDTLNGDSHKVIGELGAHKSDIALICEALEDGPQAGFKVLQALGDSHPHTHRCHHLVMLHA